MILFILLCVWGDQGISAKCSLTPANTRGVLQDICQKLVDCALSSIDINNVHSLFGYSYLDSKL